MERMINRMGKEKKGYQKFIATAATAVIASSALVPAVSAEGHEFKDVSERYKEAIDLMVSTGAKGLTSTSFGVGENIKRVDAAVLLANVLKLDTKNAPDSGFTDVPARAKGAVNALKEAGITQGKEEDTFGSDDLITRGELAIWIQKGFKLNEITKLPFKDVSDRYESAVQALFANQVTEGISATEFGIEENAKRGDYAIFLHKALQAQERNAQEDNFELSVMHTNDTHANLDTVAQKATAIKEVRAEKPDALLVDAGDVLTGTLYYNQFKGQADLKFMNLMGYDAMTFGNHEFDSGSTPEGHKELADFIKGANFPFVSSNIDFSTDSDLKDLFKDEVTENAEDGQYL